MILDANKPSIYKRNADIFKDVFLLKRPNIKKAVYVFPNNSNYMVWFNYEAKQLNRKYIPGKPGNSSYINIYNNNDETIIQIIPKDKKPKKQYDNKFRITFKKTDNGVFFCGIYKFSRRIKNNEYFVRISKKFDTSIINKRRVLLCNIAYMNYYQGITDYDKPFNGGNYVKKYKDAYEKHNFSVCKDNIVRGFVETSYKDGCDSQKQPRKLLIQNIDQNYKNEKSIDNVLVIFCARNKEKKTVVVGWYKNATVFRDRQYYDKQNNRMYNICTTSNNAFIVNDDERTMFFPRKRENYFGFGQTNFAYLNETYDKNYIKRLFNYIEKNSTNNYRLSTNYKYFENKSKRHNEEIKEDSQAERTFRRYQARFRNDLLNSNKCKCELCNINNENLLVASHIKPYSKCNKYERIDPNNGLLLCVLHDALFDKCLISFNSNGHILIKDSIFNSRYYKSLGITQNTRIKMNDKKKNFMNYHRKMFENKNL